MEIRTRSQVTLVDKQTNLKLEIIQLGRDTGRPYYNVDLIRIDPASALCSWSFTEGEAPKLLGVIRDTFNQASLIVSHDMQVPQNG